MIDPDDNTPPMRERVIWSGTPRPACAACRQPMGLSLTCTARNRQGVTQYGQDCPGQTLAPGQRCHDCSVAQGGIHHVFCCVAFCLTCQDQRLCCPCDDEYEPL